MMARDPLRPRLSTPTALLTAALALASAPLAGGAHSAASRVHARVANARHGVAATAAARASNRVQITVTDAGFTPASATADAGLIHISVDNQSADAALTLRVAREGAR